MKLGSVLSGLVVAVAGCTAGGGDPAPGEPDCGSRLCAAAVQALTCCRLGSSPWVGFDECSFQGFDVEDECGGPEATACSEDPGFVPPDDERCAPSCHDSRCRAALLARYCCGNEIWDSGICDGSDPVSDVCPDDCPIDAIGTLTRDCCVSESTHCAPRPPVAVTEP